MSHVVSLLLDNLALLDPDIPGIALHGANLVTAALLTRLVVHDDIAALEVFLPPSVMSRPDLLKETAAHVLPASLRGKGRLRFYPIHSLPATWADGAPRVLLCLDPELIVRDRYLRDRYAAGPMPITCDTHSLGHYRLWGPLSRFARASPVSFDSIVSLSIAAREGLRNAFDGFLGAPGQEPPCRIDLIPRGIDVDQFRPHNLDEQKSARRVLRLPLDSTITMFLGRVTAHGKADLLPLLRAFANSTQTSTDILLIAGEEYPEGYGRKLIEHGAALGLADRLIVHPRVDPALRSLYYGAADIFVFPGDTVQEMFGNTVLEAMASGLPCVVSDWDGLRGLVVDGVTGYAVPTWWMPGADRADGLSPATSLATEYLLAAQRVWVDTRSMANSLVELLVSPEKREAMGAAGRTRVEREYSWPSTVDRWIDLWDELAAAASRETESERAARRAGAIELGLPTPYDHIFAHYATRTIDPRTECIRLSSTGNAVTAKSQILQFYDEVLPIVDSLIIDALFTALTSTGSVWTPISEVLEIVTRGVQCSEGAARYHISLLLKRDILELRSHNLDA